MSRASIEIFMDSGYRDVMIVPYAEAPLDPDLTPTLDPEVRDAG